MLISCYFIHRHTYFLGYNNSSRKTLSDESKDFLDSDVSDEEILKVLKKTKNNKSPGPDGIIFEFYKLYWNVIGGDLCEILRQGLEDKQLSYTQYLATIILLYKKGIREDIRNWRPISLLNTDYKLLSKCLAERVKLVLKEIINPDQRGCVPGRYIGENIRLIDDVLYEIDDQDIEGLILQIDQEKAFDRVEWTWLFSCLSYFNFGDKFISYIKTMYKNAKSSIMTNGYQSIYFDITRGIRQGDALSALLYIIQFEPLMNKIRENDNIQGVNLNLKFIGESVYTKGCQYVDDSNNILKNFESVGEFFELLKRYEKVSGSKVNIDKTVGLSNININREDNPFDFAISTGQEKVLGVALGKDRNENDAFWNKILQKLRTKLNIWKMRDLSYEGKSLIIRAVAVSQMTLALEMTTIKDEYVKRVNDMLYSFLWSGKNIKISREICSLPRSVGGLNIVNMEILIKTKRIRWVIRALQDKNNQPWAKLMENYLRCLDNKFDILFFSLKVSDSTELINNKNMRIPTFYKECIQAFQELNRLALESSINEIAWCNDKYKFRNKPLTLKHWAKSGIKLVGDLYEEGAIKINRLRNQLRHKAAFLFEILKIKKAFPSRIDQIPENNDLLEGGKDFILGQVYRIPGHEPKILDKLTSKEIYHILLLNNMPEIKSKTYWNNKFPETNIDFDKWIQINICNNLLPNKVKDFQWKIFHGLVNTGTKLKLMKFSDGKCKVCRKGIIENLEHLIYDCYIAKNMWQHLQAIAKSWTKNMSFELNKLEAISGYWEEDLNYDVLILNTLLSLGRYYMWKMRCKTQYDNLIINSFAEISIGLKFYILDHLQTLLVSRNVAVRDKEKITYMVSLIENHNWN